MVQDSCRRKQSVSRKGGTVGKKQPRVIRLDKPHCDPTMIQLATGREHSLMNPTPESIHWLPLLLPGLLSAIFGLIGVAVGGWITNHNQSKERRHRRCEEQLRFYAELLSIRMVIRAKSELRLRLSNLAHAAWQDELRPASEQGATLLRDELYARRSEEYDKLADYSDNQLRDEL